MSVNITQYHKNNIEWFKNGDIAHKATMEKFISLVDAIMTTTMTLSSSIHSQTSSPSYNLQPMENYPKVADVILHAWLAHPWWSLVGSTWNILMTCNTFPCSNVEKPLPDKSMPLRKQDTKLSNWKNKCLCTLCKRWTRTSLNMTLISSFTQVNIRSLLL